MLVSVIQIFGVLLIIRLSIYFVQTKVRKRGTQLLPNEKVIMSSDGFGLTILTNRTIIGGPVGGKPMTTVGRMVLTDKRLMISSNQGLILMLSDHSKGLARPVGPKRLVVLGKHKQADVRLELTVANEQGWAEGINALVGADCAEGKNALW